MTRVGGLIRISDPRLGTRGDSPALQRDSILFYANKLGYTVADDNFLELWEPAGDDAIFQPAEKAVEFCKSQKLDTLIVVNIERFTRGGEGFYLPLKRALQQVGVQLLDAEGVISTEKVNTLEEYGVSYSWSVFDKSEEEEIKKAAEARTDRRKTLTKMIKAELRYASLGYWMYGSAPYGLKAERVDTPNGLRWLLVPFLKSDTFTESDYITKMFELKAIGKTPAEIVEEVNGLGYRSRYKKKRHPEKNKKDVIIGQIGGKPLTEKQLDKYLTNPVYAGVLWEYRMVDGKPRKQKPKRLAGTPLISIDLWNNANKGKWSISEDDGQIYISRGKVPYHLLFKNIHNDKFPYKQHIACPICRNPLYSGTSRNGSGVPDPRYHCNRSGHYWSVKRDKLHNTVKEFIKNVRMDDDTILRLKVKFINNLETKRNGALSNSMLIDDKIGAIKAEQLALVQQAKKVSLPMIIKSIEDDISAKELELGRLINARNKLETEKSKLQEAINYYWHFLERPEEVMLLPDKPIQSAKFFSLMFEELPTLEELELRTANLAYVYKLNDPSRNDGEPGRIRTCGQLLKRQLLYR